MWVTVDRDKLTHSDNAVSTGTNLLETKILINSSESYADECLQVIHACTNVCFWKTIKKTLMCKSQMPLHTRRHQKCTT